LSHGIGSKAVQRAWSRAARFGSACQSIPRRIQQDPNYRILAHQTSRFTHYYFYVRDEALGPIIIRVASFFPFHATYWLNGHSFMERELKRNNISFRKNDNAFLAVDSVAAFARNDTFRSTRSSSAVARWACGG